ncbi:MAG: S41 family peptidase [Bacteroidota bacterium]
MLALLLIGCSKSDFEYSKVEAFEDLQESIARYSASIDSRNVNWDSLVAEFRVLISESQSEEAYFETLSELLLAFRDPHIWLLSPFRSLYSIDHLGYTRNYDESLAHSYLSEIIFHAPEMHSGFINDSIGYLFCADFRGNINANNDIYRSAINRFSNTKGIILDLRVNDGGSVYNAQNLLNKFTDDRRLWHSTQNRTLDGFDEPYEWSIEPDQTSSYDKPVIVLTGRYTINAGERFAIGAKQLDHLTIIGDTTANTQGSVMGREMLNGWTYTLTFEKCLDPNGVNYAGVGIPPDESVAFEGSLLDKRDYILERAIELLE